MTYLVAKGTLKDQKDASMAGSHSAEITHNSGSIHPPPAYGSDRELNLVETACAKAIIVGEHAVVYGARAVAMPVGSMNMQIRLKSRPQDLDQDLKPTIRVTLGGQKVSDHLHGVVHDAFSVLGIPPFSVELEGHSNVLIGAGLGSSASLCIVVLRAIANAADLPMTREQLAVYGNKLEQRFHGNPSGLDTAVVAMEQVIAFARGKMPTFVNIASIKSAGSCDDRRAQRWTFALLDSGSRSSTKAMIQVAQPFFLGEEGQRRIKAFDNLATDVIAGLGKGQPDAVAAAMNEAAIRLAGVGIVSSRLRDIMAAADAAGALASKPTGAGGGGCVLALLDSDKAALQIAALNEKIGATRVYPVELS